MNRVKIKNIIISFLSVVFVAVLGAIFVEIGMEWFNNLIKPIQWIPNFVIPVVWSVIYFLSVLEIYYLLKNNQMNKSIFLLFIVNGILNVLWCLIFFTLHLMFIGQIIILLNLIFGFVLLLKLNNVGDKYFNLLFIYPCWLSIATCLNMAIWILN